MSLRLDRELGKLAVVQGVVTPEELEDCLKVGGESAVPVGLAQVLMARGLASQGQIDRLMSTLTVVEEMPAPTTTRMGAGAKFGRYDILAELGRGGMGAVYKARDPVLDRVVALKVLSDRFIASDEDVHRFQRESKLAARVRHPNLVQIFEAGILDGTPFFTMEYVDGRTMDEVLIEELVTCGHTDSKPRLAVRDKVHILIKVAEAIHVMHRVAIIHRDLKPANIILDALNEPHVMDFGLAREVNSRTMLTSTGTAMGTPSYMPPEQASGDVHNLDGRADVYSLGAVLYHALTLRLPFVEATPAVVLRRVIEDDPIAPRQIDPAIDRALERIIMKAMAKNRNERYANAADFARDLERYIQGQPVAARGPSPVTRVRRWVARHPAPATAVVVAIGLLTAFATYLFFRPGRLTLETTPADAEAFVDGRTVGRTPLDMRLARGHHDVRVVSDGYRELRFLVDIGGGRNEFRRERLEQRVGRVTLESEPSPAEVRLTGPKRIVVHTPVEGLLLPEGRYRLEAFRPQYQLRTGVLEIGDLTDGACRIELLESQRWQFAALEGICRAPVAVELTGDGVADVVVASRDGRVYALSGRDGRAIWTHDTRTTSPTDLLVMNGDVFLGVGATGFICLRGADGVVRYFVRTGSRTLVSAGGQGDVVTATWDGCVTRWDGRALAALRPERRWSVQVGARVERLEALEAAWLVWAQGDRAALVTEGGAFRWVQPPAPEIAAGEDGYVLAPGWKFRADQAVRSPPVQVDVDGDGAAEVVFGADDQRIYVLDGRTGTLRWYFQAGGNVAARVAVADLTGDGLPEIIFGTTDGIVRAVSVVSR